MVLLLSPWCLRRATLALAYNHGEAVPHTGDRSLCSTNAVDASLMFG